MGTEAMKDRGQAMLPCTDENGYYEIRLESIGGLGANLAGKMLGELGALTMGLNASGFSSYGSEKKGSPVRAYVRYREGEGEILRNAPVIRPHLLGVFHEAMAKVYPVFAGVFDQTQIVLNTWLSKEEAADKYRIPAGVLYCLDAGELARQNKCRLNMVMLGALAAASGFLPFSGLEKLCQDSLGKKYPDLLAANLSGMRSGYEAVAGQKGLRMSHVEDTNVDNLPKSPAGCGLDSMAEPYGGEFAGMIGGVNPMPGNSVQNDLSAGREGYVPVFHPEKCIQCGLCDSTCPDMVFRFEPGEWKGMKTMINQGPVYQYCKGCLRCVSVCPVAALTKEEEQKARKEGWLEAVERRTAAEEGKAGD